MAERWDTGVLSLSVISWRRLIDAGHEGDNDESPLKAVSDNNSIRSTGVNLVKKL